MSQLSLDPIAYSEALQAAGMPKGQADVIARTQQSTIDKIIKARELATKKDISIAVKELELRLSAKIDQSRIDTLKWTFAMFLAFGGAMVALLK